MSAQENENLIKAAGKDVAPRVKPADIEANIKEEYYFTARNAVGGFTNTVPNQGSDMALRLLTFCVLVLRNNFTVTGESACASPENFDAEIGRKIARQNAVQKMWSLMGYELRSRLDKDAA
jgi:Phage protein (N4 Gp49/phage Sf6 gene 66) family